MGPKSTSGYRQFLLSILVIALSACGGGDGSSGGGDSNSATGGEAASSLALFAGDMGGSGSVDGVGAAARFNSPQGVATDGAGNVYVADSFNNIIRKITPAGVVTTLAGTAGVPPGSTDATGAAASFSLPISVATDSAGNVYVADANNGTIRKITPSGAVSTVVGVAGQAGFAPGALPGMLESPRGVAVSGTVLYIALLNAVAVVQNLP